MINTEDLLKQSTITTKNEEIFKNYVFNNFDMNIPAISGKYYHTLRVTKNCAYLSKKLDLDVNTGINIGLLHDFARFNQWEKYSTFVDLKSEDHADMAVNMLFKENMINNFDMEKKDYKKIYYAIKYHNKPEIDFDKIKNENNFSNKELNEIYLYAKIARDGDKIDLLNRIIAGEFNVRFTENGFTQNCLNRVLDHKFVFVNEIKTKLDRIFCFIGFLYDLNFYESFELFSLEDFYESLLIHYSSILPNEDLLLLKNVINDSKNYFIKAKKEILAH